MVFCMGQTHVWHYITTLSTPPRRGKVTLVHVDKEMFIVFWSVRFSCTPHVDSTMHASTIRKDVSKAAMGDSPSRAPLAMASGTQFIPGRRLRTPAQNTTAPPGRSLFDMYLAT